MTSREKPGRDAKRADEQIRSIARDVLGHLSFSSGKRDNTFLRNLNELWRVADDTGKADGIAVLLRDELAEAAGSSPVFADVTQAEAVIGLALGDLPRAYREHHADLLHHLEPADFEHPYLLGCFFEAVLSQGGPWSESERIITGSLAQLNDFVGYRPVAVLENGRKMELYPHERLRAVPVFVAGAGVAGGRYEELIQRTLRFFEEAPQDLLEEAHFSLERMGELAIDVRAHDHLHPVNKRTNYMFGEWDPHCIDVKGNYRRFIVRKIIVDSLVDWIAESPGGGARRERVFDAAAALCGTMLMASSISGSGPETHDSTVSLTSLLPEVARRRDAFYTRLMDLVQGARAKRLKREQRRTQQPFGHVRQYLNMRLASYGARQVQHRELAYLFARMGHADDARQQAAAIPAPSIRFECELQCHVATAMHELQRGELDPACERIFELKPLLRRAIECGAFVDPWNILGFHGQFPLFSSREDAIPDHRVEVLLELMEDVFDVFSRALSESAAQQKDGLRQRLTRDFQSLAQWWDQFGSDVVEDLPEVSGDESFEAACTVADVLSDWRSAGEASGDISFWREHVEVFDTSRAHGDVVAVLLSKRDYIAAMGMLMQWLSRLDEFGFESSEVSVFELLLRWMNLVTSDEADIASAQDRIGIIRRFFDYLEVNSGRFWSVPNLGEVLEGGDGRVITERGESVGPGDETDEDEDNLFGAAYEGVVFRDSADDGSWSDTLDSEFGFRDTEFEALNRELEPRLKFLNAVGLMWQMAAAMIAVEAGEIEAGDADGKSALQAMIGGWRDHLRHWEAMLRKLISDVWKHEIPQSSGDHDANVEYDLQLQVKQYLLNQIITALVCLGTARRLLEGCHAERGNRRREGEAPQHVARLCAAVIRRDTTEARKLLPLVQQWMERQPLLYVPLDHGGKPEAILRAQTIQSLIRFLLRELPRMGLLREAWQMLKTAFQMERQWRPEGQAITEFDRLFQLALRSSLTTVLRSSRRWRSGRLSNDELIDAVTQIFEPYQHLWTKHADTMRLSCVDGIRSDEDWKELEEFIRRYGAELFHASQLTLGNVRAILHNGVGWYLSFLEEHQDPLRESRLVEDLRTGRIDRADAEWCLETVLAIVVDRFDRFLEYNTTTTQSDYGEMLFCLIDFLRVETNYDRYAWSLTPMTIVHEMLIRDGHTEAASVWAATFEAQTSELADQHLDELSALEQKYGVLMPTIRDHLNQRFVKPLAVNRMLALVKQSVRDAARGADESAAFERLQTEITSYLENSWGSGVDIPAWLRTLNQEVEDASTRDRATRPGAEAELDTPQEAITLRDFKHQLRHWQEPLVAPSGKRSSGGKQSRSQRSRRKGSRKKSGEG